MTLESKIKIKLLHENDGFLRMTWHDYYRKNVCFYVI